MRAAVWMLLAAALAGCLGTAPQPAEPAQPAPRAPTALSEPMHGIEPPEEVWVEASDGVRLHNAVYRPDTDEPVPVFINFSPYWGDTAMDRGDPFARYMIERYVPRGYAVVLSAVRGTGHSEGCFQIGGVRELRDLHEVVDRFAEASWSTGKVAAGGKSYDSTSQNGMIAKFPHDALEGIFHVSGISDMYRYTYRNGVPYGHGLLFNTYYYLQTTDEYGVSLVGAGGPGDESPESLARAADDAACPELPEIQASGVGSAVHGMKTSYWQERDWNRDVADSEWNGSVFFVHGLQDWNVKPDHVLPWLDRLPDDVPVKGWLHQDTFNRGHVYPMRADWNRTMLRWLDATLKGRDVTVEWGFQAEGDDGVWRASTSWPPADVDRRTVEATLQDDRATLIEADNRTVRIAGVPTVNVTATSTHADPVLTAILYEVDETGEPTWTNEAVLRGTLRDGLEEPDAVPPGEAVAYTLEAYPQDDVLEPGHALVVEVGQEPRYAEPWPGQMQGVTYAPDVEATLPVAPTDTALPMQPEPTPCFAC